jgi:hypothetical protein
MEHHTAIDDDNNTGLHSRGEFNKKLAITLPPTLGV